MAVVAGLKHHRRSDRRWTMPAFCTPFCSAYVPPVGILCANQQVHQKQWLEHGLCRKSASLSWTFIVTFAQSLPEANGKCRCDHSQSAMLLQVLQGAPTPWPLTMQPVNVTAAAKLSLAPTNQHGSTKNWKLGPLASWVVSGHSHRGVMSVSFGEDVCFHVKEFRTTLKYDYLLIGKEFAYTLGHFVWNMVQQ